MLEVRPAQAPASSWQCLHKEAEKACVGLQGKACSAACSTCARCGFGETPLALARILIVLALSGLSIPEVICIEHDLCASISAQRWS